MPATRTLRGVELVRAGTWAASTGRVTITRDDLEAIVAAAGDPEVDRAAIRIGHVDPRFDGEPALGWVENLRVNDDVLVGDLVEVPAMLAELIPRAFRRRSVEIAWQVTTAGGATHRAALTGLALLGVAPPAVKGLADVAALYGRTAASSSIVTGPDAAAGAPAAAFVTACTIGEEVAGDDPTDDAVGAALATMSAGLEALTSALAATIPTPTADAPHNVQDDPAPDRPQEAHPMPVDESRIRELLNLEADADLEAELERIAAAQAGDPGTAEEPPAEEPPAEEPPAEEPPAEQPAGAAAPEPELVTLSAGALAELQAAAATVTADRRDRIIATALSEGRIAVTDQQTWRDRLEVDEAGTVTLLSSITPAFPTTELGADLAPNAQVADDAFDQFEADVFGFGK